MSLLRAIWCWLFHRGWWQRWPVFHSQHYRCLNCYREWDEADDGH